MADARLVFVVLLVLAASLQQVQSHASEIGSCHNQRVVFSVALGNNYGPFDTNQEVVWDTVFVNEGYAFDTTTGRFTAPVSGLYFFTVSVHKRSGLRAPFVFLKKDGDIVFAVDECCNTEDNYDGSSNTAVIHLNKGQVVWVELATNRVMATNLNENTFTGFLLSADYA